MMKLSQHRASAGYQVKMKMWNFYALLIICRFTGEILCSDTASGKQTEAQTIATTIDKDTEAQVDTEKSLFEGFSEKNPEDMDSFRFSRAVPRIKTERKPSSENKPKNSYNQDYVVKIPLSVVRQYELYRLLWLQENEDNGNYEMPYPVIPIKYHDKSDLVDSGVFQHSDSEKDIFSADGIKKDAPDNTFPVTRDTRSMLLLSSPKSEDTTKEKPPQTFVLPYPRPGRSNKYPKNEKANNNKQLILPYPRPGRSLLKNTHSKIYNVNNNNEKYILPTARLGRSMNPMSGTDKDSMIIEDWISRGKFDPPSLKLNKEALPGNEEYEGNSFFVIPYPRPGKKSTFKLKNKSQETKKLEKDITDYILPYPRPGKKSGRLPMESKEMENTDYHNLITSYEIPQSANYKLFEIPPTQEYSDVLNINGNIDSDNSIEHKPLKEFEVMTPSKKYENKFILPYLRPGRNFDSVLPYPRLGRSITNQNGVSDLFYGDVDTVSDNFPLSWKDMEDYTPGILRFKRSLSVVPYPRLGRSNAIVPYPRLGRSNAVIPYPRSGRSNSVVLYPRLGRSNSLIPYSKLGSSSSVVESPRIMRMKRSSSIVHYSRSGRSDSVVPYPRPGRSESVVPYPRPGRSKSLLPYSRPGRSESVVPYPRPGRAEFVVPYPRPGRAEYVVPYPRPGRSESVVPYPRPGRAESVVPYPRPGRSESVVPYPRPGRTESVIPYPRPGRSKSLLPYPRPGRTQSEETVLPNTSSDRSNHKQEDNVGHFELNARSAEANADLFARIDRTRYDQGYILPHPRVGRSLLQEKKKRESSDMDTIIPYPRLGRSQKETVPLSSTPEFENSVHKLNKHMLKKVEDSVYLLPYPRPGRYSR